MLCDHHKDLLRWDQSLADQCTLHQIRSNHRLSHFNHFHQSYHFQFAIPSKVVLNECHGHFVRSFGTPAQRKRGFYIAIVPLSLTTHQPQNAIFTFVGRFWSESQSISFVVRPECVWCLSWVGPLSSVCPKQKGGFVPRLECGAAMRVRPTVVGRASSDNVRRLNSADIWSHWAQTGRASQAAAPLALNQHMPRHHQNQHLQQKHWLGTMFGSQADDQDYELRWNLFDLVSDFGQPRTQAGWPIWNLVRLKVSLSGFLKEKKNKQTKAATKQPNATTKQK